MPRKARLGIATALRAVPPTREMLSCDIFPSGFVGLSRVLESKSSRYVLGADDSAALYRSIVSLWLNPTDLVLGSKEARGRLWDPDINAGLAPIFEGPQLVDGPSPTCQTTS